MGSFYPTEQRRGRSRGALANGITRMMTNSMVVYLTATFMQRIWGLLNSDILQFIRRASEIAARRAPNQRHGATSD